MNKWIEKSIKLSNSSNYLDKLFEVYPVNLNINREISEEVRNKIKASFEKKDKKLIIKDLLDFPKFPIDDPYISSLRRHRQLLEINPETINRIGDKLLSTGFNNIIEMATKPKSSSRQIGASFHNWLRNNEYQFLPIDKFIKYGGISFLDGSDGQLKNFAEKYLKIKKLERRPDFLLKVKNKFIIGEAKFLTDYGGTQNNQFDNALKITKIKGKNYLCIAVIDGIVWFDSNNYMNKVIKRCKDNVMSALLLREFINNF